jgi:hypothetical protein
VEDLLKQNMIYEEDICITEKVMGQARGIRQIVDIRRRKFHAWLHHINVWSKDLGAADRGTRVRRAYVGRHVHEGVKA